MVLWKCTRMEHGSRSLVLSRIPPWHIWEFVCCELVFRLVNPLTTRDEVGLRTAIMNSYTASQSLQHWLHNIESAVLTGARQAREPQADPGHIAVPEPAATTWTTCVADDFMRTFASLQRELLGKRIISYLIEWCSTPKKQCPGFACQDTCKVFDKDGDILQTVAKSPGHNIYTYMDIATADPVLDSTASGVYNFLSSTFWSNKVALKCQLAAMCLSLRGMNIDRAFWTVGPGGVGQSLNTHLIANMFGSNHGFVDMQVFYSDDDELRKQADSLVDKRVVNGQESPVTDRTMRSDLYKKHMSADPVAGRPPYGIVTRMLQLNGWKRFEMNDALHFTGVTEATFPSMKRRALVIVMKARFWEHTTLGTALSKQRPRIPWLFSCGPIIKDLSDFHTGGCSLVPYFVRVRSDTYRGSV